jgi:hypothetical protein
VSYDFVLKRLLVTPADRPIVKRYMLSIKPGVMPLVEKNVPKNLSYSNVSKNSSQFFPKYALHVNFYTSLLISKCILLTQAGWQPIQSTQLM